MIKGPKQHKWQQGLKEEEIGGELLVKKWGHKGPIPLFSLSKLLLFNFDITRTWLVMSNYW